MKIIKKDNRNKTLLRRESAKKINKYLMCYNEIGDIFL